MTAQKSYLSSPKFGYDFVVATTQASINATMKAFLSGLTQPVVTVCYVADQMGNPVEIDYAQLKKNAHDSDPFAVPANADPSSSKDIRNLIDARFMMGFRAQIGLPPGLAPGSIPDIVTLGSNTASVTYNLMCSKFSLVKLTPGGGYSPPSWFSQSQPAGNPWIFQSKVDLRLSNTPTTAYGKLPPAVQAQIKNLGSAAFTVQQLLFDLDNAALESIPTIKGVPPGDPLYSILQQFFLGAYFAKMRANGSPVLGCTIKETKAPTSTLTLTDLNLEVAPFLGTNNQPILNPTPAQQDLATLNYLCAADGNILPSAALFDWNWVEQAEQADFDGVVAINRNTFANYFRHQLAPYVPSNCYLPTVRVTYDAGKVQTNYAWSMTSGQTPTVTMPLSGPTVLTFHYGADSVDQAGLNGDLGKMQIRPSYDVQVSFSGKTIKVVQHLVVYLYVRSLATSTDGNVVDLTVTDTYALSIGQDGRLAATLTTTKQDDSKNPSVDPFLNFWTDLNKIITGVENWLRAVISPNLKAMPVTAAQNFVFPGGRTFAFKSAGFSDYGDLISRITYTDPS